MGKVTVHSAGQKFTIHDENNNVIEKDFVSFESVMPNGKYKISNVNGNHDFFCVDETAIQIFYSNGKYLVK